MLTWDCICGNRLHFDNNRCLQCNRPLGYWPQRRRMLALEADDGAWASAGEPGMRFRRCRNDLDYGICNWLIEDTGTDTQLYCLSCRRNQVIPDLSQPYNPVYWARLEAAKRLLIDDLLALDLPMDSTETAPGMRFAFLADEPSAGEDSLQVLTGHTAGLITINVAEADPAHREELRVRLGEPYRTLIGHMRHQSGHYYWARLAQDPVWMNRFREHFGDERQDYAAALGAHYAADHGTAVHPAFVSAYATAHPWEDFAETWAHYLHIRSGLETAAAYGLHNPTTGGFQDMIDGWLALVPRLNAMARALGKRDLYPFILDTGVMIRSSMGLPYLVSPIWKNGCSTEWPI